MIKFKVVKCKKPFARERYLKSSTSANQITGLHVYTEWMKPIQYSAHRKYTKLTCISSVTALFLGLKEEDFRAFRHLQGFH